MAQTDLKLTDELTENRFHEALHSDIGTPHKGIRGRIAKSKTGKNTRQHANRWAQATVNLKRRSIAITAYLNFKQNRLSNGDYDHVRTLACDGIRQYWSRPIDIANERFSVTVTATHRVAASIPVDLKIANKPGRYSRSMNPGIFFVDADFVYNEGAFQNDKSAADADFRLVAAHEFGHSVLQYAGGIGLSWGHKGSTGVLTQAAKMSTPGYPQSGPIDLMKYYDWKKGAAGLERRVRDTAAAPVDIKRLIWGAKLTWAD